MQQATWCVDSVQRLSIPRPDHTALSRPRLELRVPVGPSGTDTKFRGSRCAFSP